MDYELRIDDNGGIWRHSINRKGRVLASGSRVFDRSEADALVASGEARWQPAPKPSRRAAHGLSYEQDVQRRADAGEQIQPCDWNHAMNRDD